MDTDADQVTDLHAFTQVEALIRMTQPHRLYHFNTVNLPRSEAKPIQLPIGMQPLLFIDAHPNAPWHEEVAPHILESRPYHHPIS